MAGIGYIGQAGTGKTTKLIARLNESLDLDSWPNSASLLAITFMHGSRRRLEEKLKPIQRKGVQVNCMTIDSYSLNLLQRYRSYLGIDRAIVVDEDPNQKRDFEGKLHLGRNIIRQFANELLEFKIVKQVQSFSYPIVVVDEFQDCDGLLLEIVKKLNACCELVVAADDFQNLNPNEECIATKWLSESIELKRLEHVWRTNDSKILDSSVAIRSNAQTTNGVETKYVASHHLAAFFILSNMQWNDRMGGGKRTVAIISPVGPSRDAFVRQTLERIQKPMTKKNKYSLGPRPFFHEGNERISALDILTSFNDWKDLDSLTMKELNSWSFEGHLGFSHAVKRAKRIMKLRNVTHLSKTEFSGLLSSGIHFVNTFLSRTGRSRIFLTVHGAKNREFDDVFIIWPNYTLPKGDLYRRKLMYNAITRAKRKVVILVQDKGDRSAECPLNLLKF
ncbi:ATP-binding domain-containing protein [Salegentibacter flavus]|uniref:DNA 3'-5' helicase II n=1 Tax=Salegentibacter flavus TaxID=287099 RepID=A0A1I4ZUU8_9FLAO|nr:ATP-binding domain-containing protein [Salegentibacter flavus]SFN54014.1 UvrD-like helicase C-terminal domain-containing protein [Salegentibacter flavus]